MSRPTEYPPVEGMSIKALKKLLDRESVIIQRFIKRADQILG